MKYFIPFGALILLTRCGGYQQFDVETPEGKRELFCSLALSMPDPNLQPLRDLCESEAAAALIDAAIDGLDDRARRSGICP